ncbi:MAG: hypothetical protein HWD85_11485 [Flavobacteriaceae bacterium]|nr:hypothetical protein [Flavobacteriaceae bacterium]
MLPICYTIASIACGIVIQIGLTKRRKIIEKEKRMRLNLFKDMNDSKINAIGNYEEKAKSKFLNK